MARRAARFGDDPPWQPVESAYGQPQSTTIEAALAELLALLKDEIPTFSPRYLGHMVSDISLPGLLGHVAMLFENANLASREAAMVASKIETEAINLLADMVGLDPVPTRGHFTSGGTLANFEAVWRAATVSITGLLWRVFCVPRGSQRKSHRARSLWLARIRGLQRADGLH